MRASKAMVGSNKGRSGINHSAFKQDSTRKIAYGKVPTVGVLPKVAAPKSGAMKPSASSFKAGYKAPNEVHAAGVSGGASKAMSTMKATINYANNIHDSRVTMRDPKGSSMNKNLGASDMLSKRAKAGNGSSKMGGGSRAGASLQRKSTKSSF